MTGFDSICREGERASREEGYQVMRAEIAALHAEIDRLRLTDAEREAIAWVCGDVADITEPVEATLRGLLERTDIVKK